MTFEMGIDTFGDVTTGPDGQPLPHDAVLRDVVEEAVVADQAGLDFIGLGEHHRADFAISSPEVLLGAIASRTSRIKLGTAVTVLSSDDPIRVFQRFSTLNAVSNGRAEVILGRGSFTESFPLFGYDLSDYEVLFEEKLDLFVKVLRNEEVTWQGSTRPALSRQRVYPTLGAPLPVWIGVGGSPGSIIRAVRHELPVMLAVIGGPAVRFRPFVDLWQRAWAQVGKPALPIGLHSHGHVAPTDEEAVETVWPHYRTMFNRLGRERGWPPVSREQFESEVRQGSQYVGSPETVARRIAAAVTALGVGRFDMKYSTGGLPHDRMVRCIELYGTRVVPMVRDMLSGAKAA
ncbi:MAG: LLM class flavin-dependent oxidoreductase [Pseudomonadota bacterium]